MKIALFTIALLLAGCASARPPVVNDARSDAPSTSTNRSTGNYSRDASECERQAALASAGSKAQAFDRCMRARNQTSTRP
ncbi:MAG: hypothetical protein ACM3TN_09325 [Alphaproteobacteria bacterium]